MQTFYEVIVQIINIEKKFLHKWKTRPWKSTGMIERDEVEERVLCLVKLLIFELKKSLSYLE